MARGVAAGMSDRQVWMGRNQGLAEPSRTGPNLDDAWPPAPLLLSSSEGVVEDARLV